jgi:hypothetical protein
VEIKSNGGADFKALGARFRAAGKNGAAIRKATTKKIQTTLARITDEQKSEIMAWKPQGSSGRGEARRAAFVEAKAKRRLAVKGRKTRARSSHSLRSYIKGGIKSRVSYSGYRLGATIFVDPSALPPSQRALPKYIDRERGWRHPTWGHRDRWVQQTGTPYFSKPIERHRVSVRRDVHAAVDEVMRTLQ